MGVRGLASFVTDNSAKLLITQEISGSVLVVDGYNLLHELYYNGPAETAYGGDYEVFANCVAIFYKRLKSVNISPYFVFDGSNELGDMKFNTSLQRAKERIHLAGISSHRKRTKILPCLAFRACVDKFRELNIPYCVCDHEADQQLASLALQWSCPLVSNDTDFLLQELPGGVISVNDLNVEEILAQSSTDSTRWDIRIYRLQKLCEIYNIKDPVLVTVLSIICGNDTFPHETLSFFRKTLHKKPDSIDIDKYLRWFAKFDTVHQALDAIIRCSGSNSQKLKENIKKTLASYMISTNHVHGYFANKEILHDFKHPLHEKLPVQFWHRYRTAQLPKRLLEVLLFRRRVFSVQMEALENPSAWLCSKSIRQLIYQILAASYDGNISTIKEYDREKKKLIMRHIAVDISKEHTVALPQLYEQSEEQRLRLFYQALGITESHIEAGVVDPTAAGRMDKDVLTAVIVHWVNQSRPVCLKIHVMAILACIINLSFIEKLLPEEERVCQQMGRYAHAPTQDQKHKEGLVMSTLHAMAQLQCVISDSLDLLGLLGVDVALYVHNVFSGRYVYNLCIELSKRLQPALYCEQLLVRGSNYSDLFKHWYSVIERNVSPNSLVDVGNSKVNPKDAIKAAKRRAKRRDKAELSDSPDEKSPNGSDNEEDIAERLLGNKFAALSLSG